MVNDLTRECKKGIDIAKELEISVYAVSRFKCPELKRNYEKQKEPSFVKIIKIDA